MKGEEGRTEPKSRPCPPLPDFLRKTKDWQPGTSKVVKFVGLSICWYNGPFICHSYYNTHSSATLLWPHVIYFAHLFYNRSGRIALPSWARREVRRPQKPRKNRRLWYSTMGVFTLRPKASNLKVNSIIMCLPNCVLMSLCRPLSHRSLSSLSVSLSLFLSLSLSLSLIFHLDTIYLSPQLLPFTSSVTPSRLNISFLRYFKNCGKDPIIPSARGMTFPPNDMGL